MKLKGIHTFQVHRNEKIKKYLDSIQSPYAREVAVRTIDWIKDNFPECKEILQGELIYEEIQED